MGEIPYTTVVPGTTITASWGNANVRDQVVTPFASASARTSAITSPVEGMFSYRSDDKVAEMYDGSTYVPIGWRPITSTLLGATTGSVTWTSIPQTFKHLMIVVLARGDTAASYADVYVRFNNDSATNYGRTSVEADMGGVLALLSASTQNAMIGWRIPAASLAVTHSGGGFGYVHNYTDVNWRNKDFKCQSGGGTITSMSNRIWWGVWDPASPAAVTRIDLFPNAGSFVTGSYFALYGFGA